MCIGLDLNPVRRKDNTTILKEYKRKSLHIDQSPAGKQSILMKIEPSTIVMYYECKREKRLTVRNRS